MIAELWESFINWYASLYKDIKVDPRDIGRYY